MSGHRTATASLAAACLLAVLALPAPAHAGERVGTAGLRLAGPVAGGVGPSQGPTHEKIAVLVVATADKAAGTDLVRSMANRAGAEVTEIESSHVVMMSHPQAVTDVIVKAARAVEARNA